MSDDCGMSTPSSWSAQHFSQANPAGQCQNDIPALLRRVADSIAALGDVEILDLVMHEEVTEDGNWPSITVYYTANRPRHGLTLLPQ